MTKKEIIEIVQRHIVASEFSEALELLSSYAKGDKYAENELLLHTASYNRSSKNFRKELITLVEYNRDLARLGNSLDNFMNRLPDEGNDVSNGSAQNKIQKILFLTSNPINPNGPALRLEAEMRGVLDELRKGTYRDLFEVIFEPGVAIIHITGAMKRVKPQIIHFSGHGTKDGIVVEDENTGKSVVLPIAGLVRMFKRADYVKFVMLNACNSMEPAKALSERGIYVIGMSDEIYDKTAGIFAKGLYQSLVEGEDIEAAYDNAMVNISHREDAHLPELWYKGEKISD